MTYIEFLQVHGGRMADGTVLTVVQFLLATVVAVAVAVLFGLMRLSRNPAIRGAATVYVEIFRGTSLLIQLFWIFFVLPIFGLNLDKFVAGFLAVGLNMGAYGAELVRGAILSVPTGQWEAAVALNMTSRKRMWRVILPQAFVIMLPPWGNLVIEILKGTALVALISVTDLMFEIRQINISTFMSVQAFGTALIVYYVLARFFVTPVMRALEHFMSRRIGRA
ncbi:MAG: ectoine/hydroxyectoine ABC transporter permease subunit EhuC [Alphaproteobacteria bacterium]|nr:ectoine/hydroxyectoine ABC transporter permease subunit EhuC [Alphaproteobacteria bacterium]